MPDHLGLLDTVIYLPTGHQGVVREIRGDLAEVAFYRGGVVLIARDKLRKIVRIRSGRRVTSVLPECWLSGPPSI